MDKVLLYYDYEAALASYEERLMKINQAWQKNSKMKNIAKPVLLLTVLKAIDDGNITENHFEYDTIKRQYNLTFSRYFFQAEQQNATAMLLPWYHLTTDKFWILSYKNDGLFKGKPSEKWIHDNVSHAYFEDDLWILVQNRKYRRLLMEFMVEKKIRVAVEQVEKEKGFMAAEGRWLKSLLMLLAM